MSSVKEKKVLDQKGQTFLEFIFILVLLMSLSFTFMHGFTGLINSRWQVMIKLIARPNTAPNIN